MYTIPEEFDSNWENKSEKEILDNIMKLNKNRKKYDVFVEDVRLKIEHDFTDLSVNIVFYPIEKKGTVVNVAKINGKNIYGDKSPTLYNEVKNLYYDCKHDQESLKLKIKKVFSKNKDKVKQVAIIGGLVLLGIGIEIIDINYENKKQIKAKQEKIDFAKSILKSYEAERAKGAVNIDSLINQHIK